MGRELSIFQRLLLLVFGAGLLIALASGVAHHYFTARLMKQSVHGEMDTALRASVDYFERTYMIAAASDMHLLESSPLVDAVLASSGNDELITRPEAERLFLAVIRSKGGLHTSIRLVDADAKERIVVMGNRRDRNYRSILEPAGDPAAAPTASLYRRLRVEAPGTILAEGPFVDAAGAQAFLVGITKSEPEIGGFGGAIIAQFDLSEYLQYLSQVRVFDHSLIWVFDPSGTPLLVPRTGHSVLDPRPFLFAGAAVPNDAIVLAEDVAADRRTCPCSASPSVSRPVIWRCTCAVPGTSPSAWSPQPCCWPSVSPIRSPASFQPPSARWCT